MVEIKYKKISESSLNDFSKIIYSDILKYYMDKQRSDIKKISKFENKNRERQKK